jgi:hypothetical protein
LDISLVKVAKEDFMAAVRERRIYPRTKANWHVEVRGLGRNKQVIRESSKMEDLSPAGACFLSMCDVELGSKLFLKIKPPVRSGGPFNIEGEVVRIDNNVDVGKMFKAVVVRWKPTD